MSNLFSIKIVFILAFSFTCVIHAQVIVQQEFNFKGFAININDDIEYENGQHLLVGEIRAIETEAQNRDTTINNIFDLNGYSSDYRLGILIVTDKNYKTLQIAKSFIGKKITYDRNKKQFTIGANFFDYLHINGRYFSAWQPVIVQLDLEFKGNAYFVQKPYSCILENMVVEGDEILIFTRSDFNKTNDFKSIEKAELIRLKTSEFHIDSAKPWIQVLEPISNIETPYNDAGRMTLSDISTIDNAYYFSSSNLDQFTLENINHLYQFKNNQLTEIPSFSDYLKWQIEDSKWININGFLVNSAKNYLFLCHEGATKKEMIFSKTDTSFNTLISKKIALNDYADFNNFLLLPNGNILILAANDKKKWSYFLYDSNMQLIKEISSEIPKDYYPNYFKTTENQNLKCIFYIDNVKKKDCVLQVVDLD